MNFEFQWKYIRNNTWWYFSTPANRLLFKKFAQAYNKENIKTQNQWSFVIGLLCYQNITVGCILHTFENRWSYIWTNLFITAYNNTDMTVLRKYITSQWRYVRDMASQITRNSTVVFRLKKVTPKLSIIGPLWGESTGILLSSLSLFSSLLLVFSILSSLSLSYHYHFQLSLFSTIIVIVACLCYHDYNHYYY